MPSSLCDYMTITNRQLLELIQLEFAESITARLSYADIEILKPRYPALETKFLARVDYLNRILHQLERLSLSEQLLDKPICRLMRWRESYAEVITGIIKCADSDPYLKERLGKAYWLARLAGLDSRLDTIQRESQNASYAIAKKELAAERATRNMFGSYRRRPGCVRAECVHCASKQIVAGDGGIFEMCAQCLGRGWRWTPKKTSVDSDSTSC